MRRSLAVVLSLIVLASTYATAQPPPLPIHAHNDYRNAEPLLGALRQGVASVEVDIYRVGDRLLVAHDLVELPAAPELTAMYLHPLRTWFAHVEGCGIYDESPLTLLVDFKSHADSTYALLLPLLETYGNLFTRFEAGAIQPGCVTVAISGNRPVAQIRGAVARPAFLDGRFSDAPDLRSPLLAPMVSGSWLSDFKWMGGGPQPEAERRLLAQRVDEAHEFGQRIRFWASPDNETIWAALRAVGADYINTDRVADLAGWIKQTAKE